jgi:hypothetical protein
MAMGAEFAWSTVKGRKVDVYNPIDTPIYIIHQWWTVDRSAPYHPISFPTPQDSISPLLLVASPDPEHFPCQLGDPELLCKGIHP